MYVRVCVCLRCFSEGYDYPRSSAASFHSLCRQERACITLLLPAGFCVRDRGEKQSDMERKKDGETVKEVRGT